MKKLLAIILIALVIIATPFLLEIIIFRNNVVSVLSNNEWASFLGSYLGGVIGGICALLAIYFSTKGLREGINENRKINKTNNRSFLSLTNMYSDMEFSKFEKMKPFRIIHNPAYTNTVEQLNRQKKIVQDLYNDKTNQMEVKLNRIKDDNFTFLVLKNISQNTMFECDIHFEIVKDSKRYGENYTIPCLSSDEKMVFLAYDYTFKGEQEIMKIIVNYKTTMNEQIKYEYNVLEATQRHILIDGDNEIILLSNSLQEVKWSYID